MTKEEFEKLAKRYLVILQNPNMNENGIHELKIYGFENLYNKIFPTKIGTEIERNKVRDDSTNSNHYFTKEVNPKSEIKIPRYLLENIRNDIYAHKLQNKWRENTTKANIAYLNLLENEILQIDKLLKQ